MLGNLGPLMLIDNVIRMQNARLPVVQGYYDNTISKTVFSFGNTLTTSVAPQTPEGYPFQGVVKSYDDKVVDPHTIPNVAVPLDVYQPPNLHRTIYEVLPNASGPAIQQRIDLAVSDGTENSVVHLPFGKYHLRKSLIVPVGRRIQLIGDDSHNTELRWG